VEEYHIVVPPEPDPKAPSIAAICSPIIPFVGAE
jgi:hypothetical protein